MIDRIKEAWICATSEERVISIICLITTLCSLKVSNFNGAATMLTVIVMIYERVASRIEICWLHNRISELERISKL
ncbi:hypothetical protein [Clostridium baratii]|uniref:hypothetical protein n=1 Tax=Clostridium baratii TaxID=1561 RepID=UPI0030D39348